tara:strand:+ start:250 stop:552 length:303 start_codon:yes stop_codon:yes gene_type:complete
MESETETRRPYLLCQKVDANEPENVETVQLQTIYELTEFDTKNKSVIMFVFGIIFLLFGIMCYTISKKYNNNNNNNLLTVILISISLGFILILFSVTNIV